MRLREIVIGVIFIFIALLAAGAIYFILPDVIRDYQSYGTGKLIGIIVIMAIWAAVAIILSIFGIDFIVNEE